MFRFAITCLWAFCLTVTQGVAATTPENPDTTNAGDKEKDKPWFVSELRGPTFPVQFDTKEATWINVTVSPDGQTLAFDVLGDLYSIPARGGEATPLTHGPAYDHQPRFSPDGKTILFTSDRGGSDNVWMIEAGGENPRPVTQDKSVMNTADFSPDGEYIIARKRLTDRSSLGTVELWMYHMLGGKGIRITDKDKIPDSNGPVFSPDGRWIYFAARNSRYRYNRNVYAGIWNVRAFDRETGNIRIIADGYGGSGRPNPSPDGNSIAFVRRDRDKTCLVIHDLETGGERVLLDCLDQDMQENFAWTGVYPGYQWSPDSRSIFISYGGTIHRVDAHSAAARTIPFTVHVDQTVAEPLKFRRDVAPDNLTVRMISWPQRGPDGTLYFSALGRLYRVRAGRTQPEPLKTEGNRAYCPQLSPNGKELAYAGWSDAGGGHIWIMPSRGGASRLITRVRGQYANPSFSPDGSKLVFVKGMGATNRGDYLGGEPGLELHWSSINNPHPEYIVTLGNRGSSRSMPRPRWSQDGRRVYFFEEVGTGGKALTALASIRPDGTDRRDHIKIPYAEEIIPSPDGKWFAYSALFKGGIAPLPLAGQDPIEVNGKDDPLPVYEFADDGVNWLNWSADSSTLTWSFGPEFYSISLEDVEQSWLRRELDAGLETKPRSDDEDSTKTDSQEETVHPDTLAITLTVPRAKPRGTLVLNHGRIITMEGELVHERGTLVVEGDRISAVGQEGTVNIPSSAHVVDCAGKTIIPGFIDVHAHMHYRHLDIIPEAMSTYYANLAYGVTTTHDPSASTYSVFTQSEMVEAGLIKGPRTFSTGFILYGADAANKAVIENLDDARKHVKRLKRLGAFSVKSYMQPHRDQRQWILAAAREESMLVVPEGGGNLEMNLGMVIDGHTGIEHALPVTPLYNDVVQLFAKSGCGYTPTLLVAYGGLSGEHWFYQHYEVWQDQKLLRFTPRGELDARARRRPVMAPDDDWHHMDVAAGCKKIVEAGGKVQLGAHGQLQGLGAHWELWGLTQGGMRPFDALRCATLSGAEYLGLDAELGSLETGKLADILVLNENPLVDIHNSNTLAYIIKNGELFDADTMDELWPRPSSCPTYYWQESE